MGTFLDALLIAVGILLSVLLLMLGVIRIGESISLPGEIAKIEQLRNDILLTNVGENEDVMGQATAWNQRISEKKAYNSMWWSDILVPDKWDDVKPIDLGIRANKDSRSQ